MMRDNPEVLRWLFVLILVALQTMTQILLTKIFEKTYYTAESSRGTITLM